MDPYAYSSEARRERVALRARHRAFAELVRTNPDVAAALKDVRRSRARRASSRDAVVLEKKPPG